jgi:biotin carboxyl carrier protein
LDSYTAALELTVIALGALLVISLCFLLLTRGLQWMMSLGKKEGAIAAPEPESSVAQVETPPVRTPVTTKPVPRIADAGVISSPMPGTVLAIKVEVGAQVRAGDVLLVMESMKIENEISAPSDGRVREIYVVEGVFVRRREPLIAIEG